MKFWERIRNFFIRNEIYLKVIELVLVGVVGTIISVNSYRSVREQTEISKAQQLPVIKVQSYTTNTNSKGSSFKDDVLEIANDGSPIIRNVETDTACFLRILVIAKELSDCVDTTIPLRDYYVRDESSNVREKGLLAKYTVCDGNRGLCDLSTALRKQDKIHDRVVITYADRYIRIRYKDYKKDDHIEYYKLDNANGPVLLGNKRGEQIFSEYNDSLKSGLGQDYKEIDSPRILKYIANGRTLMKKLSGM